MKIRVSFDPNKQCEVEQLGRILNAIPSSRPHLSNPIFLDTDPFQFDYGNYARLCTYSGANINANLNGNPYQHSYGEPGNVTVTGSDSDNSQFQEAQFSLSTLLKTSIVVPTADAICTFDRLVPAGKDQLAYKFYGGGSISQGDGSLSIEVILANLITKNVIHRYSSPTLTRQGADLPYQNSSFLPNDRGIPVNAGDTIRFLVRFTATPASSDNFMNVNSEIGWTTCYFSGDSCA